MQVLRAQAQDGAPKLKSVRKLSLPSNLGFNPLPAVQLKVIEVIDQDPRLPVGSPHCVLALMVPQCAQTSPDFVDSSS